MAVSKATTKAKKSTKGTVISKASKNSSSKTTGTRAATANEDILKLILEDHKPLKKLIKVLKDSDKDLATRQKAFEEFAPLLIAHAKPEEQTLYVAMKEEDDMRVDGCEGDTEHAIADQLVGEIKAEKDADVWTAKAKVLAELVEHHIEEEEEEMFPEFKKKSDADERALLGAKYQELRQGLLPN
jgi:hemerythrin superfamily protein